MTDVDERRKNLQRLVRCEGNLNSVCDDLNKHDARWDREKGLVCLQASDICAVLRRYITGDMTEEELSKWAGAIEMRDDIDYQPGEEESIADVIIFAANPDINGPVETSRAKAWLRDLSARR